MGKKESEGKRKREEKEEEVEMGEENMDPQLLLFPSVIHPPLGFGFCFVYAKLNGLRHRKIAERSTLKKAKINFKI